MNFIVFIRIQKKRSKSVGEKAGESVEAKMNRFNYLS